MTAKRLIRWLALPIGLIIFLVGAIMFPLPIPVGLILMAVGLAIAAMNPIMLRFIRRIRKRYPATNKKIRGITPMMPTFIRRFLKRTDSNQNT